MVLKAPILILPCAGRGTRLNIPYPKELHAIGPNKLLIDFSLKLAKEAGITDVIFVVTQDKLFHFKSVLGGQRFGLKLHFVIIEFLNSLPGASLLGCQYGHYELGYNTFIIGLPDTIIENPNAYEELLRSGKIPNLGVFKQPATKYDAVYSDKVNHVSNVIVKKSLRNDLGKFVGTWGIILIDFSNVKIISELMMSSPINLNGDIHLFGELIDQAISSNINKWHYTQIDGDYLDLGTWEAMYEYMGG